VAILTLHIPILHLLSVRSGFIDLNVRD
jgi:hypothetical protein